MADAPVGDLHRLLIDYPDDLQDDEERKNYKRSQLINHPETLRADQNRRGRITNLLFYTGRLQAWGQALLNHYGNNTRNIGGTGIQIQTQINGSTLTVYVYNSGTIMFQGNEATLGSVPGVFNQLIANIN